MLTKNFKGGFDKKAMRTLMFTVPITSTTMFGEKSSKLDILKHQFIKIIPFRSVFFANKPRILEAAAQRCSAEKLL